MTDVPNPVPNPVFSRARTLARLLLGAALTFAGVGHLSFARQSFQAQVPPWLPLDPDLVVVASGVIEVVLGVALLVVGRRRDVVARAMVGWLVAGLFVVVLPGNVSQLLTRTDAFGLDTDLARAVRLLFQPLLVLWALWASGAWAERARVVQALRRGRARDLRARPPATGDVPAPDPQSRSSPGPGRAGPAG